MKISSWTIEQRRFVAGILEELIKSQPNNKKYELILDGFYSQQMFIEHLLNLLGKLREEVKMLKSTQKSVDLSIGDGRTIYGDTRS